MNREENFHRLNQIQERAKMILVSRDSLTLLAIFGMILLGLVISKLLAGGNWLFAVVGIFAIPAFIVLLRFPFITLIIWLVLSPFLVQTPSTAERMLFWLIHRMLPVATLGIMIVSSGLRISKRWLPRFSLAEYAMVAYLGATVVSILLLNDSISATLILFYDRVFIPMCLYWVIKLSAPGENTLKWLVPVALFITVTQIAIGTVSWIMPSVLPSTWTKYVGIRTTGSLNSVSVFTATITFTGAILLYTALQMKHGWKRNILILAFLATLYGLFISFSRASWLASVVVLLGVFTLYPRFMSRLFFRLLPVIVLLGGTLMVTQLQFAKERFYSADSAQTALSRLPVMVAAYRMFEQKPITGWGYGNFDLYDRQFQGRFGDLVNPDEKDLTSHNMFLTLLAEQGLVGFTLFIFPILWLLFKTIQFRQRLPERGLKSRNMTYLLWLVVLSFVVVMNFAPIVVVFGLGLFWVTLGLISNTIRSYSPIK